MTCGIHSGGWKPPTAKLSDLFMLDLKEAVTASGSPFKACKRFIPLFEKFGKQYGGKRSSIRDTGSRAKCWSMTCSAPNVDGVDRHAGKLLFPKRHWCGWRARAYAANGG